MPKKKELPASSDVSGQDMPTTEAPWNHKVMDYIAEVFIWFIPTTGVPLLFLQAPAKRKRPAAAKEVVEERTQDLKYR